MRAGPRFLAFRKRTALHLQEISLTEMHTKRLQAFVSVTEIYHFKYEPSSTNNPSAAKTSVAMDGEGPFTDCKRNNFADIEHLVNRVDPVVFCLAVHSTVSAWYQSISPTQVAG